VVERGPSRPRFAAFAAAVVSTLCHPLLIIPVTVLLLTRDLRVSALLAAATVLPLLVITLRNVRRGTWTNFDVSDRGQRGGLYYAAVPLTLVGAGIMYAAGAPPALARGTLVVGALLLAALLLSPFLKTSLHMLFAGWCGVMLMRGMPATVWLVPILICALAWSRLYLKRHTWPEVAVGLAIGAAGAWLA
jgi:hypothetical protein